MDFSGAGIRAFKNETIGTASHGYMKTLDLFLSVKNDLRRVNDNDSRIIRIFPMGFRRRNIVGIRRSKTGSARKINSVPLRYAAAVFDPIGKLFSVYNISSYHDRLLFLHTIQKRYVDIVYETDGMIEYF